MNARVLTFKAEEPQDGKGVAAFRDYHAAFQAALAEARAAGVRDSGDQRSALSRMFHAGNVMARLWERRAERLQRQLQAALASDALDEVTRASIVKTLTGSTRRDAKLLTAGDRELLDAFSAITPAEKGAIRRVLLAMAGAKGGARTATSKGGGSR